MRLVSWNCTGAFHKKAPHLLALEPDVAIVPECAAPEVISRKVASFSPTSSHWMGESGRKGLAVFTFGLYRARVHQSWDDKLLRVLPVEVDGPESFNLLAIWAYHPPKRTRPNDYVGPTIQALSHYRGFLEARDSVVVGDFNNHIRWDRPGKPNNHSNAVATLKDSFGLVSAYHSLARCEHGAEPDPTHWWQWREDQPYHIDYCFIPQAWLSRVESFSVGKAADWLSVSDHAPLSLHLRPSEATAPAV